MDVLSIGNSFSEDAQRFLSRMALHAGTRLHSVNLMIGGCPLCKHATLLESGEAAYGYECDGEGSGRQISLPAALKLRRWDVVTFQQVSGLSGEADTYEPYLGQLVAAVRQACPTARLLLQETWAYHPTADHGDFPRYDRDPAIMYARLHEAYADAAQRYGMDVIPSGTVIRALRQTPPFDRDEPCLYRDGFHMALGYGRYAVGAAWLKKLTGLLPPEDFVPAPLTDTPETRALLRQIRETVNAIV